jgi:hypothetical protein
VLLSNAQNPLWQSRFHKVLLYCLQSICPSLNQICSALKVKLWLWSFQQKIILFHQKIYYQRILSFNGYSKSLALIRRDKCFLHVHDIKGVLSVWTLDNQIRSRMLSVVAEKTENNCADAVTCQDESSLKNRCPLFARQNIFGLCISLGSLSGSGKLKLDSNVVSSW